MEDRFLPPWIPPWARDSAEMPDSAGAAPDTPPSPDGAADAVRRVWARQPGAAGGSLGYFGNSIDALSRIPGDLRRLVGQAYDSPLPTAASVLGSLPQTRLAGEGPMMAAALMGAIRSSRLPMDVASRMARATEGDFAPMTWFHATRSDIPAFERRFLSTDQLYPGSQGFWFARSPAHAATYAGGEGANIIPARLRLENAGIFDWNRRMNLDHLAATVANARAHGHGAVIVRGYGPGLIGRNGRPLPRSDTAIVFEPHNIRSIFAAFDPARRMSPDMLAGAGALGVLGAGGFLGSEPQDEVQ